MQITPVTLGQEPLVYNVLINTGSQDSWSEIESNGLK